MRIFLFSLLMTTCSIACISQGQSKTDTTKASFANYPGGETAWKNFIYKNFNVDALTEHWPDSLEFRDTMQLVFAVNPKGMIENIQATGAHTPAFKKEIVRVLLKAPLWMPAAGPGEPISIIKIYRLIALQQADLSTLIIEAGSLPSLISK